MYIHLADYTSYVLTKNRIFFQKTAELFFSETAGGSEKGWLVLKMMHLCLHTST